MLCFVCEFWAKRKIKVQKKAVGGLHSLKEGSRCANGVQFVALVASHVRRIFGPKYLEVSGKDQYICSVLVSNQKGPCLYSLFR